MAEHRPRLLKTHRARIENMLYVLPTQMWPTHMLYYHVMSRLAEGIRESVLICKAWGVTNSDQLDELGNELVYCQMEAATLINNTERGRRSTRERGQHNGEITEGAS